MLRVQPISNPARGLRAGQISFPAPTGGWITNRNLAMPTGQGIPQGAEVLENFFPTAAGILLRRGSQTYAELGDQSQAVTSMFKYIVGNVRRLFASTSTTVYDITNVTKAYNFSIGLDDEWTLSPDPEDDDTLGENSTGDLEVIEGALGGDWSTVQFATTGGVFLIGVNGASTGFIYDGDTFYPNLPGGVWSLAYDGGTVAFTEGETVTGGTSGATATVVRVVGDETDGVMWLSGITGTFENNEALTDGEGGAALAAGVVPAEPLAPGIEFPSGSTLTTADLSYVWAYKNRLWFLQKESLTAWYLPVDQVGGELAPLFLGSEFGRGGSLIIGQTWSLASGGGGGLSEQVVFVTTEGEVAVYQGSDPTDANDWRKVGVYRTGIPLGPKAILRAGGDLIIGTTLGAVPLSQSIQVDFAALASVAISYPIDVPWNEAIETRGQTGWTAAMWSEQQMAIFAPPVVAGREPSVFVSNARTGAWASFTNWPITCMETFNGRLLFGTANGFIKDAMVGGSDDGQPYTGSYMPLFSDNGAPTSMKTAKMARATIRSSTALAEKLSCRFDFDTHLPPPPVVAPIGIGNEWNNAIWDQSVWDSARDAVVTQRRHSVSGQGYRLAGVLQITSGSTVPLDAELISLEVAYQTGAMFT